MTTRRTDAKPGIAEIEADIARTREELADTVDELAARLDVKARAKARVQELRSLAGPEVRSAAGILAAVIVASAVVLIWRRRRS